jgi:hypothetical protein
VLQSGVIKNDRYSYALRQAKYKGGSSKVEIDHVVSLADAWRIGARDWSAKQREKFANDFMNLEAIDSDTTHDKSDHAFDEWRPADPKDVCWFAARQMTIKKRYELTVTTSERETLIGELQLCDEMKLLKPSKFRAPEPKPIGEPKPQPKPTPKPEPEPEPSRPSVRRGVHPGAFCSPAGALGTSSSGTPMICKSAATAEIAGERDDQLT